MLNGKRQHLYASLQWRHMKAFMFQITDSWTLFRAARYEGTHRSPHKGLVMREAFPGYNMNMLAAATGKTPHGVSRLPPGQPHGWPGKTAWGDWREGCLPSWSGYLWSGTEWCEIIDMHLLDWIFNLSSFFLKDTMRPYTTCALTEERRIIHKRTWNARWLPIGDLE